MGELCIVSAVITSQLGCRVTQWHAETESAAKQNLYMVKSSDRLKSTVDLVMDTAADIHLLFSFSRLWSTTLKTRAVPWLSGSKSSTAAKPHPDGLSRYQYIFPDRGQHSHHIIQSIHLWIYSVLQMRECKQYVAWSTYILSSQVFGYKPKYWTNSTFDFLVTLKEISWIYPRRWVAMTQWTELLYWFWFLSCKIIILQRVSVHFPCKDDKVLFSPNPNPYPNLFIVTPLYYPIIRSVFLIGQHVNNTGHKM